MFDPDNWIRALLVTATGVVSMALLACGVALARDTTRHDWYATGKLTLTELVIRIGFDDSAPTEYRTSRGEVVSLTRDDLRYNGNALVARGYLLRTARKAAELGACCGFGGALLCLVLFRRQDQRQTPRPAREPASAQQSDTAQRLALAQETAQSVPAPSESRSGQPVPVAGGKLLRARRLLREGLARAPGGQRLDGQWRRGAWSGRPGRSGHFQGEVPDGSGKRLGRRIGNGEIIHRPGRDLTFSAPKSVSLAALVGGDGRIVNAHDRAVGRALGWFEKYAAETRVRDPATARMVRVRNQKSVIATFRHETSRNLDPALHTHSVIANMLQGPDGKWRTMANERLYASKMLLGALYRSELARELKKLGYGIEKTHADGRFEIAGVSREMIEAFSTRRAEIEAAMHELGLGTTGENPHLARRAALMTRAHKRDVDREVLRGTWARQATDLGLDARGLVTEAMERSPDGARGAGRDGSPEPGHQMGLFDPQPGAARLPSTAVDWALAHLSERDAVFAKTELFAAALAYSPGKASIKDIERAVDDLKRDGRVHDAPALAGGELTTDLAVADERETVALMRSGRGKAPMRGWMVERHLRKGPLTHGQKQAVKLILSEKDRTVGVQGYAGTGKTTMLKRTRALAEKKGWRIVGLAPSASAVQTLAAESGIESETLQRFLARNSGVAEGRLTKRGQKALRGVLNKTVLVVDEGSLASTVQTRDLLPAPI